MIYTNSPSLTGTSYLVAGLLGTELFELLFLTVFCYLQFVMVALAVFCAHLQSLDIDHPHAMAAILNICQVNITVYLFTCHHTRHDCWCAPTNMVAIVSLMFM